MMAKLWHIVVPAGLALAGLGWWLTDAPSRSGNQADELGARFAALRAADKSAPVARAFYGRRLEPKEPVVLHGAGQSDETSFAAYTQAVAPAKPVLSMSYVDLREDIPAYFIRLRTELARYPELIVPQIGLSLNAGEAGKHFEAAVALGEEDAHLRQLMEGLRSLDRPVFLRIGYEFNGSWNGYTSTAYVAAFRHIRLMLRNAGLENVATVWDWSAGAELDAEEGGASAAEAASRYMAFYPGDEYVDWWALNLFSSSTTASQAVQVFLTDADRHRMPVMIGESTPKGRSVQEGEQIVHDWYAPYFGLIRSSRGIKAFCYIDWDWSAYRQWADWGDARIERNPAVLDFYKKEVGQSLYANARGRTATLQLLRAK